MNLLLILLILIGIYLSIYLYNRYYNYSIKDAGNVQIKNDQIQIPKINYDSVTTQENNCKYSDKLIKKYIQLNEQANQANQTNQSNQSNQANKLEDKSPTLNNLHDELTNLVKKSNSNINLTHIDNDSSEYIDGLMKNVNLDVKPPITDNPNCTDGTNKIEKQSTNKNQSSNKKNVIDWYLTVNSECDNFDLVGTNLPIIKKSQLDLLDSSNLVATITDQNNE